MIEVPDFGPMNARVALLAEAPGLNEEIYGRPLIGPAGDELRRMLAAAGLDMNECYLTNVFPIRPEDNNIELFFTARSDPNACVDLPARNGKYLKSQYRPYVDAILPKLSRLGVNLVIALGGTALWALHGKSKISAFVGCLFTPSPTRPFHSVSTYHPAAVLRQYSLRSICIANFLKAKDFLDTNPRGRSDGANRVGTGPARFNLAINPTLNHVRRFTRRVMALPPGSEISVDIETDHGQITVIGFSLDGTSAICIPFWQPPGPSYWPNLQSEVTAWGCVRSILARKDCTYIFQNGPYDTQWLWRGYGIPVLGSVEDTMWAHHALEPELPKGLGPLAAIYLKIPEWKTSRVNTSKDEE